MAHEMMALTLDIAVRTLFGTTLPGEAEQVGQAMTFSDALFAGAGALAGDYSRELADAQKPSRQS